MILFAAAVLPFAAVQPESGLLVAGKYRLGRRLARGGMGAVWEARHVDLDTLVALKFPHVESAASSGHERFKREARLAAMLKSQYIVQIYDFGFDGETPYLAMELLVGEDLGLILERESTVSVSQAIDWTRQAGLGLRAVHRAGLVHRDVKPSNLSWRGTSRSASNCSISALHKNLVSTRASPPKKVWCSARPRS